MSSVSNFPGSAHEINLWDEFENYIFEITAASLRVQWVQWTNDDPIHWWMHASPGARPINSLRPRRNRRHFADDIFKCIFLNENEWISLRFSLKFVNRVRINNIPSLVQVMAWRRPGDKPLFEPMMVSLLTHICVTRPQWVNDISNKFKIWPKFAVLQFKMHPTNHNEILYTSRQCNYCDTCKISLWSVEHILNLSIPNFGWISNLIEISLVGQVPGLNE